MPESFKVIEADKDSPKYPRLVTDDGTNEPVGCETTSCKKIWHYKDTKFNSPKVYLEILVKNPLYFSSPEGHVLTRIYTLLLNDYFATYLYQVSVLSKLTFFTRDRFKAILAENFWRIQVLPDGLLFTLGGFGAIMPKLTNRMADLIADYEPDLGIEASL